MPFHSRVALDILNCIQFQLPRPLQGAALSCSSSAPAIQTAAGSRTTSYSLQLLASRPLQLLGLTSQALTSSGRAQKQQSAAAYEELCLYSAEWQAAEAIQSIGYHPAERLGWAVRLVDARTVSVWQHRGPASACRSMPTGPAQEGARAVSALLSALQQRQRGQQLELVAVSHCCQVPCSVPRAVQGTQLAASVMLGMLRTASLEDASVTADISYTDCYEAAAAEPVPRAEKASGIGQHGSIGLIPR